MWGVIGRLAGLVVFVLGAVSGYLEFLAPQSGAQSQWIPGLLVATVSLVVLLTGNALRQIYDRETILAAFGIAAAAVFFFTIPVYVGTYLALSIPVEYSSLDGPRSFREVKGDTYSASARTARFLNGDSISDDQLVRILGGVSAVWTPESIHDYWRRTLMFYVVVASSLVCTVCFVGAFVDRTAEEQQEVLASASSTRKVARQRAAWRRRSRNH